MKDRPYHNVRASFWDRVKRIEDCECQYCLYAIHQEINPYHVFCGIDGVLKLDEHHAEHLMREIGHPGCARGRWVAARDLRQTIVSIEDFVRIVIDKADMFWDTIGDMKADGATPEAVEKAEQLVNKVIDRIEPACFRSK